MAIDLSPITFKPDPCCDRPAIATKRAKSAEMLRHAREFVADMARGQEPRWLVIVGLNGCGKSYLAERIVAWVREHGREVYARERAKAGRDYEIARDKNRELVWEDNLE